MNVRARNRTPSAGTHLNKMCGAPQRSRFVGFLLVSAAAFFVSFPTPLLAQKPPLDGRPSKYLAASATSP
jgi:hypothetical protein